MRNILALTTFAVLFALPATAQVVNFDASTVTPSTTAWPFNVANCTLQTFWTPTQLQNASGTITEFGLQFATPVSKTWPNVVILMGETTNTMSNYSTTYAANFNAVAAVTVYSGSMSVTTTQNDELWRISLQTPFSYSGANSLVVEIRVTGTATGTGTTTHRIQFTQNPGVNCRLHNTSSGSATTGTVQANLGYGASFLFGGGGGTIYPLNQQDPSTVFSSGTAPARQEGWRFQCNSSGVTVTHLTCWFQNSSSQPYTLTLFNFTTGAVLAQVTASAGTGWRNTALSTPVTLTSGAQYIIAGWNGGTVSTYTGTAPPASWVPTGTIQYMDSRWSNNSTANTMPATIISGTKCYGVIDIGYNTGPSVSTSTGTLNLGTAFQGQPGTPVDYTVSGSGTTAATMLAAPAGVELCDTSTGTYQNTWTINSTGSWGPVTIWARIKSTAGVGSISGNITHNSTGATQVNVAVNGNVVAQPVLNVNPNSLNLGTTSQTVAGSTFTYDINGTDTIAATDITAPAGVEVSLNQTNWANTAQISSTGTWAAITVYVRIAASAPAGAIAGNITNVTSGASQNVAVTGNVNPPPSLVATPDTLNLGSTPQGIPGAEFSYTLDGANLVTDTVITAPAGVEISQTSGGTFTPTITITTIPSFSIDIYVRLTGSTVGAVSGDITNVSTNASEDVTINGTVTQNVNMTFVRNGPAASTSVNNDDQGSGGNGLLVLDFSVTTGTDPFTLTDITFTESGTADGQTDINAIGLYEDTGNGVWDDPTTDPLATAAAGTSFNAANGTYTAALTNTAVPANTTRRFFVLLLLAGTATAGETFQVEVTAATAASTGSGSVTGVPTTAGNTALDILPATLAATFNGPSAFTTVDSTSQGPGGNGHVILDLTLTAQNDSWNVTSMTFTASGTADEQADINFLALYLDNGNGVFDGPGTDTLATTAAGTAFNAPDGAYTATLMNGAAVFAMNASKRFFLAARLSGSAISGETFRAALTGMVETSPSTGTVTGLPTAASSALVIDVATLTVNAAPSNPSDTFVDFTGVLTHTLASFRLSASNDVFVVTGVTLTLQGNGDWVNHVSQLRMYQDDGNGTFDGADTQLFAGSPGVSAISCAFSSNVTINPGTFADLWVVIDLATTAGGSPSETFQVSIAATTDIQQSSGNVLMGSLPPVSGVLHVILFTVTGFTPIQDAFAGGANITITGTGLALPITCTIGGKPCTGTAVADPTGTTITGLRVPSGSGTNLVIVLTTNNLAPRTLTQTFSYDGSGIVKGNGGGESPANGCATGNSTGLLVLSLLGLLALAATLRRRKA